MKDPGLAGDTQPMKRSSVSDRTLGREPWAHPASAAARNLLGYSSSRCCSCTQQKAPRSGAATARTCEKELQVRDKTESTLQISCWIVLRQIIVLKNCAELKTRFLAQHQAVLSSRGTQQSGGDVQGELRAAGWGCWGSTVPPELGHCCGLALRGTRASRQHLWRAPAQGSMERAFPQALPGQGPELLCAQCGSDPPTLWSPAQLLQLHCQHIWLCSQLQCS